jgi:hypothetical protein
VTADEKPSLASVVGKAAPAKEEPADDYEGGKQAAAEAALAAFKSGDATALASALSDFVSLCT